MRNLTKIEFRGTPDLFRKLIRDLEGSGKPTIDYILAEIEDQLTDGADVELDFVKLEDIYKKELKEEAEVEVLIDNMNDEQFERLVARVKARVKAREARSS